MKRTSIAQLGKESYDILVIGGGITGAVTARDAALRGLRVALVEKNDFAWGTSSRSTKLLHGGLRYLERFEFHLVREACRERELMLKLAPHLAHPRKFLYLQYNGYPEGMFKLKAGLLCYDMFAGAPKERKHAMHKAEKLLAMEPHLNAEGLKGGGEYYDFLTDDARLTIETVKGAADAGAHVANYVEVIGFEEKNGRISGARLRDTLSDKENSVRAKQVINTTGPWVDNVRFLEQGVDSKRLRPTKGVHIVLRKEDFPLQHPVFLRAPRDNRVVWPIPALNGDIVYIGTTDTDYTGSLDDVRATDDDIDYLLEVANHIIPGRNLGRQHIIATWAGLRPLIAPEDARNESAVSREHEIFVSPKGLLTIAGGKLTTARVMGQQVMDKAVELLDKNFGITGIPESNTHNVPLSGGDPVKWAVSKQNLPKVNAPDAVKTRLMNCYGSNAQTMFDMMRDNATATNDMGGYNITAAEVHYAVLHEMAQTVTDFFTRRASLFYWNRDGGLSIAKAVAKEMGELLGGDENEIEKQITEYSEWVAANRCALENNPPT